MKASPLASAVEEKALFLPLRGRYYDQFEDGTKPNMEEYRPYGKAWNERVCRIGRLITLSYGYGAKRRLRGVIIGFRVSDEPTKTAAWADCYGAKHPGVPAACIKIRILKDGELI